MPPKRRLVGRLEACPQQRIGTQPPTPSDRWPPPPVWRAVPTTSKLPPITRARALLLLPPFPWVIARFNHPHPPDAYLYCSYITDTWARKTNRVHGPTRRRVRSSWAPVRRSAPQDLPIQMCASLLSLVIGGDLLDVKNPTRYGTPQLSGKLQRQGEGGA